MPPTPWKLLLTHSHTWEGVHSSPHRKRLNGPEGPDLAGAHRPPNPPRLEANANSSRTDWGKGSPCPPTEGNEKKLLMLNRRKGYRRSELRTLQYLSTRGHACPNELYRTCLRSPTQPPYRSEPEPPAATRLAGNRSWRTTTQRFPMGLDRHGSRIGPLDRENLRFPWEFRESFESNIAYR